jgi:hydroxymethylbilane synthase
MWQAEYVRNSLIAMHPGMRIKIEGVKTEADKFLNAPLEKLGGKGAFIKELEQALIDGRADIAVHSMKDVVIDLPNGLEITAILKRHKPGDALVSNDYNSLNELPAGSIVGTSSLRRQCQLKHYRPDLLVKSIRGNVGTRLHKLNDGEFHALILASSGLHRLGLEEKIKEELGHDIMLPAIGQGALGIEMRKDNFQIWEKFSGMNDHDTYLCVQAERMINKRLNGGCLAPIAAYASTQGNNIFISALVGASDGSRMIRAELSGDAQDAEILGDRLGQILLDKGAGELLREYRSAEE